MSCITGDETGLLKVWDVSKSSGASMKFSYGAQSRSRGIAAMCWNNSTTSQVLFATNDGNISLFDLKDELILSTVQRDVVPATPNAMSVFHGSSDKVVVVTKDGRIVVTDWANPSDEDTRTTLYGGGPVEAVQVNRKHGLVMMGGRDNDLQVWDLNSERTDAPFFQAENVQDHVLEVPYPVYVTGACVVHPKVFGVCTAYHEVRFYDARVSGRPVQEFKIDREIQRRPTSMLQWNANKYVIGEASGDVHLYDTRRGFASRAKLRGGVGSVRSMVKHPAGYQLLGVVGLDRKARIYHVPTGKLLQTIYLKQKGQSILFDKGTPFTDNRESYQHVTNTNKKGEENFKLGNEFWDDMDPVGDDFVPKQPGDPEEAATKKSGRPSQGAGDSQGDARSKYLEAEAKRADQLLLGAAGPSAASGGMKLKLRGNTAGAGSPLSAIADPSSNEEVMAQGAGRQKRQR